MPSQTIASANTIQIKSTFVTSALMIGLEVIAFV